MKQQDTHLVSGAWNRLNRAVRGGLLVATLSALVFVPAWALSPGDSCSVTSSVTMGDGYLFVCDGANWKAVLAISDNGQSSLQVENDTGACTSDKTGRLRYNDSTEAWQYCDGASWDNLSAGGGGTPAGSDREVQLNSGGSFGADANFTYTSTGYLTVEGGLQINGTSGLAEPLMP